MIINGMTLEDVLETLDLAGRAWLFSLEEVPPDADDEDGLIYLVGYHADGVEAGRAAVHTMEG